MPKFIDGYRTTIGSRVNTLKISDALKESVVKDQLLLSSLDVKKLDAVYPVFVTALHDSEEHIPLFVHPFYLTTRNGEQLLATDLRLYLKKRIFDGTLNSLASAISSQVEFSFTRTRAILNLVWIEGDVETLKSNLYFSTTMFGRWIADVLAKAYALDARDQIIISIACSYYYQALFTDELDHNEETLQKWSIHTIKSTNSDPKLIQQVFSKMPEIKGLESLIEGIKASTENVRLKDLNIVALLTLLKNSWYGTNSKEIIAIATEHPPTWMSIVYASLHERSYRSSLIYKIAERVGKRGLSDNYLKQVQNILDEYKITDTHIALASAGLA